MHIAEGLTWSIDVTEDGVVEVELRGDEATPETEKFFESWQKVIEERAPVKHLLHAGEVELKHLASRWDLARRMKDNRKLIEKSAIVGVAGAKKFVAQVVVKASGRDNVRIFSTRDEALAWLRE